MTSGSSSIPSWTDVAGLHVQQAMAETAKSVLYLTWFQLGLGLIGTIALFITVRESRRASTTALRALRIQQEAERALLVIKSKDISIHDPFRSFGSTEPRRYSVSGRVRLLNVGKSVGQIRGAWSSVLVAEDLPDGFPQSAPDRVFHHAPVDADADYTLDTAPIQLDVAQSEKLEEGVTTAWLFGRVDYLDLFGEEHHLTFCYGRKPNSSEFETGGPAYWTVT